MAHGSSRALQPKGPTAQEPAGRLAIHPQSSMGEEAKAHSLAAPPESWVMFIPIKKLVDLRPRPRFAFAHPPFSVSRSPKRKNAKSKNPKPKNPNPKTARVLFTCAEALPLPSGPLAALGSGFTGFGFWNLSVCVLFTFVSSATESKKNTHRGSASSSSWLRHGVCGAFACPSYFAPARCSPHTVAPPRWVFISGTDAGGKMSQ